MNMTGVKGIVFLPCFTGPSIHVVKFGAQSSDFVESRIIVLRHIAVTRICVSVACIAKSVPSARG